VSVYECARPCDAAIMEEPTAVEVQPQVEVQVGASSDAMAQPVAVEVDPAQQAAAMPLATAEVAQASSSMVPARPDFSFEEFAKGLNLNRFASALSAANLTANYIDTCETPVTIFAPSDEAFTRLGDQLPTNVQILRELLCVHVTLGSLSHAELLNTRSITTISQQTHHVLLAEGGGPARVLQVGSASLVECDVMLPDGRGVLHVIDSVMCCIRLLQHCRYEQVWNKTVRPSPRVELLGEWRPRTDELHAILIHCDSWQPRFQGLRGSHVALHNQSGGERSKSFADGVIHFHELLILEKPPEMSKKKRKKGDGQTGYVGETDEREPCTSNYRMMFSLHRRAPEEATAAAAVTVVGQPPQGPPAGKHLSFCMAPEDILIRNSFHMLSEPEKDARRAEYKALSDGSGRSKASGAKRTPMLTMVTGADGEETAVPASNARPPQLAALSVASGPRVGGTEVWVQGRRFCATTQICVGGVLAPRAHLVSDVLMTFYTPALPANMDSVEVIATNSGTTWSNALPFIVTPDVDASLAQGSLMERQLSLLQLFVKACCGSGGEHSVQQLMAPSLSQPHRLLGAVLALILAGSGGVHHRGGALDLERQDAHGCTLMHYVCALRNMPALQLLLMAQVDPNIRDLQGMTVYDWARAFHFAEGEELLRSSAAAAAASAASVGGMATAQPTVTPVPYQPMATATYTQPATAYATVGAFEATPVAVESTPVAVATVTPAVVEATPGAVPTATPAGAVATATPAVATATATPAAAGTGQLGLLHMAAGGAACMQSNGAAAAPAEGQPSLAGFLTAAAAHVESGPPQ